MKTRLLVFTLVSLLALGMGCSQFENSTGPTDGALNPLTGWEAELDFSGFLPGQSIEGVHTVYQNLEITSIGSENSAVPSTAVAIFPDLSAPGDGTGSYQSIMYSSPPSNANINGLIDEVKGGFGDVITRWGPNGNTSTFEGTHHYIFKFYSGVTITGFSVRMLDFGDWHTAQGTDLDNWYAQVIAYDGGGNEIDRDEFSYYSTSVTSYSNVQINGEPSTWAHSSLQYGGDAEAATPNQDPGNYTFTVEGQGITEIHIIGHGADPNYAFDHVSFSNTGACGIALEVPLCAGQNIDVGSVLVQNDADELNIVYSTEGNWYITDTHLHIGTTPDDIPQTKSHNPKPGKFEYKDTFDPPVQTVDYTFLLTELGFNANDEIFIAAHAVVVLLDEYGNVIQEETAWGDGCSGTSFDGNNWGTYFSYTVQECYYSSGDELAGFRTQTQGGWGSEASGNNNGTYRDLWFPTVFPSGLVVGCTSGYTLTLTTSSAVADFLPAGGTAAPLDVDYEDWFDDSLPGENNPHPGGVLSGQVVALSLNVAFDLADADFGASIINLADLVVACSCSPCEGMTVQEVLDMANLILGGCSTQLTPSEINDCASKINEAFVDGTPQTSGFLALP